MHHRLVTSLTRLVKSLSLLAALACLLTACATQKELPKGPFFFPPPPDEPRIQFLTGFGDSSVIETPSSFAIVLAGTQKRDDIITLTKPRGIAAYRQNIYVSDTINETVYRINLVTKKFEALKGDAGSVKLKKPVELTVDEEGKLYVVDSSRKEILVYTAEGDFLRIMGKSLDMKPVAVAVDRQYLYVLDIAHNSIKILDKNRGDLINEIGTGTSEVSALALPVGITLDKEGLIYTTNVGSGKVLKFDRDGHNLLSFGKIGDGFGMFTRPKGIAVSDDGIMYIVDAGFQHVQLYSPEGKLLMFLGNPGLPRGSLNLPAGIFITRDNIEYFRQYADPTFEIDYLIYVVSQQGDDKINIYGFGHQKGAGALPASGTPSAGATTR